MGNNGAVIGVELGDIIYNSCIEEFAPKVSKYMQILISL